MAEDTVDWPGERQPTQLEIERAHEIAEPTVQQEFKRALLAFRIAQAKPSSPSIVLDETLLPLKEFAHDVDADLLSQSDYPYPLTFLLDLPQSPSPEVIDRFREVFLSQCYQQIYIRDIIDPAEFRVATNPYLGPALACLGLCMTEGSPHSEGSASGMNTTADDLFHTARIILSVIIESDNRETRKSDCILASLLMMTYGFMSTDELACIQSAAFIGYTGVIVRRMHITDHGAHLHHHRKWAIDSSFQNLNLSALMSWMLLLDVVGSLHLSTSTEFSTNELFFKMPDAQQNIGEIYIQLVIEEKPLPLDVVADEDALLILLALCSDAMATQRAYQESNNLSFDLKDGEAARNSKWSIQRMPSHLLPLSPLGEYERVISKLRRALHRWSERFHDSVSRSIRALFHFVSACSLWSPTLSLPHISGYPPTTIGFSPIHNAKLSKIGVPPDEATRHAWLVLDNIDTRDLDSRYSCPIWLPIVTHMASLVVWKSLQSTLPREGKIVSLRVLTMFKVELEQMFWPCAGKMAEHLDSLMQRRDTYSRPAV